MKLKINSFQHLGVPVTDLKRSELFYQSLGFKNVMASTFQFNGSSGSVAMMKRGSMIIEIYQMPKEELTEIRRRKNGRIDHIAFDVDDIDKTFATLKKNGFIIVEKEPVFLAFWKKGCKYFNILGPDKERIEFNQVIR